MVLGVLTMACSRNSEYSSLKQAERFIDAFYSWDAERLSQTMNAPDDAARVLYYQGWAQAGNYTSELRRPCEISDPDSVVCAVTVTDDFGRAMGYTATDTFILKFSGSEIVGVTFAGDDPPIFAELQAWIGEFHPEIYAGPCKDLFAGGTTPGDCARAVAGAAVEFMVSREAN
jgi:hypothetical protein